MKQRLLRLSVGMALSALLLAGCGDKKNENEDHKIKIGVLSTADSIPLYVAMQEEIFTQHDCNVELIEFGSASDQSKAMEAGELDGMMTDMVVQCLLMKGGVEVRTVTVALGADVTEGKFYVAASPKSEVGAVEQLPGSKVAVSEGTMMEFLVDSYCDELGISRESIEKVSVPNLSLRYEMLMKGSDIDCAILPEPLADYAEANGAKVVIDDTKLRNNYSISVIILKNELIEDRPEEAHGFMEAYNAAVDSLTKDPARYMELALNVARVPEALKETYQLPHYTKGAIPTKEETDRVVTWMLQKGLLTEAIPYERIVSENYAVMK